MVLRKELIEKVDFEKNQPMTKKHAKLPGRQPSFTISFLKILVLYFTNKDILEFSMNYGFDYSVITIFPYMKVGICIVYLTVGVQKRNGMQRFGKIRISLYNKGYRYWKKGILFKVMGTDTVKE